MDNSKKIKIIDSAIFVFIVIFLVSLTNSIFVNQIGYYGALVLVLVKYYITKENPFKKNGLGIAILLFLTAELISAILSNNHPNAFNNLLKRALLLPMLYLFSASIDSEDKGKLIVKIFIGAAILMVAIYLVVAYEYLLAKLYAVESKGPSLFKYVMTAGGIISFITIILFAFLINEKHNIKYRVFVFVLFLMSFVSLIANYSRAAWLGGAMGMVIILLVKKKWLYVVIPFVAVVAYLLVVKNQSFVQIYKIANNNVEEIQKIDTDGKATSVITAGENLFIADFQNGLLNIKCNKIVQNIKSTTPAGKIDRWSGDYYAVYLCGSRFSVYKNVDGKLKKTGEFLSSGKIVNIKTFDDKLYLQKYDNGLTVMLNPEKLTQQINFKDLKEFENFDVNKNFFSFYSLNKKGLVVYSCMDGFPKGKIFEYKKEASLATVYQGENFILFQEDGGLKVFSIDSNKMVKQNQLITKLKGLVHYFKVNNILHGITVQGDLYKLEFKDQLYYEKYKNKIVPIALFGMGLYVSGDSLLCAYTKRNRIGSIFDPYHITNIERMNQWATGYRIFKDNPFFGVGDIDLIPIYKKYKSSYEKENFGHLHNNYVHLIAILGLFGFFAVMYLFYKILTLNIKIYKKLKNVPFVSSFSLGVLGMFVGFLFSGLAEWNFGDHEIITLVWFLVGLNIAFYNLFNKKTAQND